MTDSGSLQLGFSEGIVWVWVGGFGDWVRSAREGRDLDWLNKETRPRNSAEENGDKTEGDRYDKELKCMREELGLPK